MLTISKRAYAALAKQSLDRFRAELEERAGALPDVERAAIEDYGRREFVDCVLRRAETHAIEFEKDVEALFELMAVYGAEFADNEETAWARDILDDDDLDGELKIQKIHRYLDGLAPEE